VLREHGLGIAPNTYYKTKALPPSARTVTDEKLTNEIRRIHDANYQAYGARKMWRELHRQGILAARCTVERLMRSAGLRGVVRGKTPRTTVQKPDGTRAGDRLNRVFRTDRPNRVWVADFTYVTAWCGVV
jgi:putative transposase